jgi:hypothetical protein
VLIDVAVSGDSSVIKRETEQCFKDLTFKIQRMWNVKTKVIPLITEATGAISESFRIYLESTTPGKYCKQPSWALCRYPTS